MMGLSRACQAVLRGATAHQQVVNPARFRVEPTAMADQKIELTPEQLGAMIKGAVGQALSAYQSQQDTEWEAVRTAEDSQAPVTPKNRMTATTGAQAGMEVEGRRRRQGE